MAIQSAGWLCFFVAHMCSCVTSSHPAQEFPPSPAKKSRGRRSARITKLNVGGFRKGMGEGEEEGWDGNGGG